MHGGEQGPGLSCGAPAVRPGSVSENFRCLLPGLKMASPTHAGMVQNGGHRHTQYGGGGRDTERGTAWGQAQHGERHRHSMGRDTGTAWGETQATHSMGRDR
ncbi:hypothetical protein FKM82_030355 [Ascaphus truei]